MDNTLDSLAQKTSLPFTKEDFFNQYEMTQTLKHLSEVDDLNTYVKQAVVHRTWMETKTETVNAYEKLMGYIQSKGMDQVIKLIEKREDVVPINVSEVEKIVYRILHEQRISSVSVIREEEIDVQTNKAQDTPISERKKPSSKLKNL